MPIRAGRNEKSVENKASQKGEGSGVDDPIPKVTAPAPVVSIRSS